jgi:hypothetical protein
LEWPEDQRSDDAIFRTPEKLRLVKSTSLNFKGSAKETLNLGGGVMGLGVMQSFLVAAVKPRNSEGLDVFVSTDGTNFAKGVMPVEANIQQKDVSVELAFHAID